MESLYHLKSMIYYHTFYLKFIPLPYGGYIFLSSFFIHHRINNGFRLSLIQLFPKVIRFYFVSNRIALCKNRVFILILPKAYLFSFFFVSHFCFILAFLSTLDSSILLLSSSKVIWRRNMVHCIPSV